MQRMGTSITDREGASKRGRLAPSLLVNANEVASLDSIVEVFLGDNVLFVRAIAVEPRGFLQLKKRGE